MELPPTHTLHLPQSLAIQLYLKKKYTNSLPALLLFHIFNSKNTIGPQMQWSKPVFGPNLIIFTLNLEKAHNLHGISDNQEISTYYDSY